MKKVLEKDIFLRELQNLTACVSIACKLGHPFSVKINIDINQVLFVGFFTFELDDVVEIRKVALDD